MQNDEVVDLTCESDISQQHNNGPEDDTQSRQAVATVINAVGQGHPTPPTQPAQHTAPENITNAPSISQQPAIHPVQTKKQIKTTPSTSHQLPRYPKREKKAAKSKAHFDQLISAPQHKSRYSHKPKMTLEYMKKHLNNVYVDVSPCSVH